MNGLIRSTQQALADDFTATALKIIIVLWAIFIIVMALGIDNKWILAGVLAYEILP